MSYIPNSGSVLAFQGTVPWSVLGNGQSVSGTVNVGNFPTNQNVSGSIVSFQGTTPWISNNVGSIITVGQGSIAVNIIAGSIAASFTPPANQSVSGTVGASIIGLPPFVLGGSTNASVITVGGSGPANQSVSGTVGASIIGTVPVTQVTTPWVISSVYGNVSGSIAGTYTNSTVASTVTGIAVMFKQNISSSIMTEVSPTFPLPITVTGTVPSQSVSGTVGASIIGQLPAGTAMLGSITAYQGTVPWAIAGSVATTQTGTVISSISGQVTVVSSLVGGIFPISGSVSAVVTNNPLNVAGSVAAFIVGSSSVISVLQGASIVGTYAEDAAHTSGDKGIFTLNVRNDTLSSVTSNDGDYGFISVGPAGEAVTANAPFTKWVQGNTSIVSGASVAVIAAQGASIFTYVTAVQLSNISATNALVTFQGASSSIIGYVPAPGNGGAVFTIPNAWKSNANGAITASISSQSASIFISMSGFISKT